MQPEIPVKIVIDFMNPLLSMSHCLQGELGKGSFQELDQVAAVKQFTKFAGQAKSVKDIVPTITKAVQVSLDSNGKFQGFLKLISNSKLVINLKDCQNGHRQIF